MTMTLKAAQLSPSLNEYGEAILTDPNGNQIPLIILVHPSQVDGSNEVGVQILVPGGTSSVTDRQRKPMMTIGGKNIPVMAVMSLTSGGALSKLGAKFQSIVETGTGASQNIAHGLGVVPSIVLVGPYDNSASGLTPFTFQIAEGIHDATNIKVTATAGLLFKVIAFA